MQSKKRDERSPTRNQTEHTMKTHDIKNGTAVKGATSIATMKDSSGPPRGQQACLRRLVSRPCDNARHALAAARRLREEVQAVREMGGGERHG